MVERLELHDEQVRKARSKRRPSRASRSTFGVRIVLWPKAPHSSQPMSSAIRRTTLGRASAATAGAARARARRAARGRDMGESSAGYSQFRDASQKRPEWALLRSVANRDHFF